MDKVSIIIPVHNTEKYIKKCIMSVIRQSYSNLEIIIVNDHSTDKSMDIINSFKDKRIIKLDSVEYGVSYARNIGINNSTGRFICFLDSDDYYDKDKIKRQVEFIKKNNYSFIYTPYYYVDCKNNIIRRAKVLDKVNYYGLLGNTCIFTSTVMFDMDKLNKSDILMPLIKKGQDTICWLNVLKKVNYAYCLDYYSAYYRVGNNSLSSNKIKAIKRTWDNYSNLDISFIKRLYYFNKYIYNAVRRRLI